MQVQFDPGIAGARDLISVIQGLGFEATLVADDNMEAGMEERQREKRFRAIKFGLACIFSVPVFLLAMVFMYIPGVKEGLDGNVGGFTWGELFKWALTTPVQVKSNFIVAKIPHCTTHITLSGHGGCCYERDCLALMTFSDSQDGTALDHLTAAVQK